MPNPSKNSFNYFNSISDSEIDQNLDFLQQKLPKKSTKANYQLSKQLLEINYYSFTPDKLQQSLQNIADKMRAHLQIQRPIKILTMKNVEGGKFERIDGLNCIYINESLVNQNYRQKVAILAHEMSHYYLIYQHGIQLPTVDENELLTELNAIYTGLGLLLLDGYKIFEKRSGNTLHKSKVGYIKTDIVRKTIVKTAYLRKQNPIWILKNVSIGNFFYFSFHLFSLIKEYYNKRRNT